MALKKSFESDESDVGNSAADTTLSADQRVAAALAAKESKAKADKPAEKSAAAEQPAEAAKSSASTEVAVAAPTAGSLAVKMAAADPFKPLENALHVDYNTLDRIMVTNGNVQNKETKKLMGDTCAIELISIQKHYVMSPGGEKDDEESLAFLKYSDDGTHTREGELMTKYRDEAIEAGYTKARIVERLILVGMMIDAGKLSAEMNGELVQMDLAPRSMANFNKHRVGITFRIGKGMRPAAGAEKVRITCEVQTKGSNNWTDAVFSEYEG